MLCIRNNVNFLLSFSSNPKLIVRHIRSEYNTQYIMALLITWMHELVKPNVDLTKSCEGMNC
jgi:hypothetical protein